MGMPVAHKRTYTRHGICASGWRGILIVLPLFERKVVYGKLDATQIQNQRLQLWFLSVTRKVWLQGFVLLSQIVG